MSWICESNHTHRYRREWASEQSENLRLLTSSAEALLLDLAHVNRLAQLMARYPTLRVLPALIFTAALVGCSDGAVVGSGGGSVSAGGSNGTPTNAPSNTGGGINTVAPDSGPSTPSQAPDTSDFNAGSLSDADVAAARFLTQATFGATEESIAEFRNIGSIDTWIDRQIAMPISTTRDYTEENSNGSLRTTRHYGWWDNVMLEEDQLRQRVTFALSQLFVISDLDYALGNAQFGVTDYYDMLARGAFGNFRNLLKDVTLHPAMGVYLSMVRNEKANVIENIRPDENYAREVMQLFTLGLFELNMRGEAIPQGNPRDAYTQTDVEEFARVFTGWNYPNVRSWDDSNVVPAAFEGRMVPNENFHDKGAKNLLNGAVAPAGLTAEQDLDAALDNLFQHSNVPPFVARHIIQRFVTSNPTPEYIERVANVFADNGAGERGDLEAVIRAVLTDDEARSGHLTLTNFGKLKEPVMRWSQLWRALDATPGPQANGIFATPDFPVDQLDSMTGQAVLRSPSVFNFFLPENPLSAGATLVSPEMQIMSEANLATTHNNWHHQVYRFNTLVDLGGDNPRVSMIDLEPLIELATDRNALLDWYNLMLYAGGMPTEMRRTLFDLASNYSTSLRGRYELVQDTLFVILTTPQIQWQR